MRRVVVSEFVSLDGVMEAPGGEEGYAHTGWVALFPDSGQFAYKLEEVLEAEALLLGRVTYEGFAAAWPGRNDEAGFANKMNGMPKFVASTTLTELEEQLDAARGRCPGSGLEAQARGRRRHSRRRQSHPRAHADGTRPRRRVPDHALSDRPRVRPASLSGHAPQSRAEARGYEDVRLRRRRPHLSPCTSLGDR